MSLPVGVVNVSERHGGHHVGPDLFATMVDEVASMLDRFPEAIALDAAVASGEVHMLGTSGTVTTLAGVHLGLPRYDRRRVDGIWLSDGEVGSLVDRLVAMDYEARVANPCIGRERADLVLAGCAILEAFRRRWRCERLRVADRGLREGLLVELMAEDGVWRGRGPRRRPDRPHG
jgi:exopolyphosphatase/guanosine-5'-triphosphate,3'-diphosphate pyrophosphatase